MGNWKSKLGAGKMVQWVRMLDLWVWGSEFEFPAPPEKANMAARAWNSRPLILGGEGVQRCVNPKDMLGLTKNEKKIKKKW